MNDLYLPSELTSLFSKTYKGQYYKGYWKIVSYETNTCDQYEPIPHLHNNKLTIVLHPCYRNSNTIYHFFTIKNNKVELSILGTRFNGIDIDYSIPPYCKSKIYKVKKFLEKKLNQENKKGD